ncbi:MAG: acyl-CoA dehydrogenase family protein [Gammaproteobacteria bacterium]|nr:acyl-CoA dehydrogenase family protein [Gammaproteobacteria bacterium]
MDFSYSDEQKLIKEQIEKFVQNDYSFETRNKILATDEGFDRAVWKQFAELGWLGVSFSEEDGGFGGGAIETSVVMEAFGGGMVVEPYLSTVVLSGNALALAGSSEQKAELLSGIIGGELLMSVAYAEAKSGYNLANVGTAAKKSGDAYTVSGEKVVVLGGESANKLIVSARTSGGNSDEDGISLFVVDAKAAGVEVRGYKTMDGARAANISFSDVPAELLGEEGKGLAVLENVIDLGTVASCAQALGEMAVSFQRTLEYVKVREQFGTAIGSFQVIQHRLVDMFTHVESSRSMLIMSSMKVSSEDAVDRKKAVSGAKVYIGDAARAVGQDAVQLHGGIGMTEELDIGHYFRRLTLFCSIFGSTSHHLKRYADLS